MAKAGGGNSTVKGVPNKHLHARVAYLHQAATHLALHQTRPKLPSESPSQTPSDSAPALEHHGLPLLLAHQLKAVSLKAQIRLSRDMKRSTCKVCGMHLLPGTTSETRIENLSKGAKKPWADVLVVRCVNCHTDKRFPVGTQRQKSKSERRAAAVHTPDTTKTTPAS